MLLVASYLFYASWDIRYVPLLMVSTAVDFYVDTISGDESFRIHECM